MFPRGLLWIGALWVLAACRTAPETSRDPSRLGELEHKKAVLRQQMAVLTERLQTALSGGDLWEPVREVPTIDALILGIDAALRLVVLNKGKRDGVEPGCVFDHYRGAQCEALDALHEPLRRSHARVRVRSAPARRSEDRLQDHPAVRDERHEEAQHAAHEDGRDLAVLDVHPDEHEALERQDRGGHPRE